MSLWGNKDSKTASGTIGINTSGVVTGSSTTFTTQAAVGDFIRANGNDYRITEITTNTAAKVAAAVPGASIASVSANTYTLSEKCMYPSTAESASSSGVHGDTTKVFGVDTTEMGVTDTNGHAGWVRRTSYTDMHGNSRTKYETLVASSSISGDQADDTEFPDS